MRIRPNGPAPSIALQRKPFFPKELVESGRYPAVIDRTYPLEDVVEASRYVEMQQKTGNVVLTGTSG